MCGICNILASYAFLTMKYKYILSALLLVSNVPIHAQYADTTILQNISKEVYHYSQLEKLGQELCDDIGPRLIGSPSYRKSQEWIINTYKSWSIEAWNENYGMWKSWQRGQTLVTLTYPRNVQLNALQLAWSPTTPKQQPISASVITLPETITDSISFAQWLPTVKGKVVMVSKPELSGRPVENWEKNGLDHDVAAYKNAKDSLSKTWNSKIIMTGYTLSTLPAAIEKHGAVAILSTYAADGWGTQRVFAARTEKIPNINLGLEDYAMLYRYLVRGITPKVNVLATSVHEGMKPVANTIAKITGTQKPDEYVMLSAHLDSWDAGTGATDNATGTILMMEVMRILKKHYPNPKRSIIVGHWGGEEQGLNGSRGYIADHPEMRDKISVLFNQDNGTGRISKISGNGFAEAYDYFGRWNQYLPATTRKEIELIVPGDPGGRGGSDYAAFLPYDIPAFFLLSHGWDYSNYTWHSQYDTYDKIVFEEVRKNAETIAYYVYLACEEPEMFNRSKIKLPMNIKSGKRAEWPKPVAPNRDGKY
jgi:carboxypeptidase Q